jgi:hypothetical protein
MRKHLALIPFLVLAGCTAAQIQSGALAVQQECALADAQVTVAKTDLKGGALDTANGLAAYEASVCGSADKIATAAADPSTAQWVAGLTQQLKALTP